MRDLGVDFFSGSPVDLGFDQVLRTTPAGENFVSVLGSHLNQPMTNAGGALPYEAQLADIEASGPNFIISYKILQNGSTTEITGGFTQFTLPDLKHSGQVLPRPAVFIEDGFKKIKLHIVALWLTKLAMPLPSRYTPTKTLLSNKMVIEQIRQI